MDNNKFERIKKFVDRFESMRFSSSNKIDVVKRGIHMVLLYLIHAKEEVTAGDLSNNLNISTPRVSVILNKLEKKNFISRHQSKEDARKIVVQITKEGKDFVEYLRNELFEFVAKLFDEFGEEELNNLLNKMRKIHQLAHEFFSDKGIF